MKILFIQSRLVRRLFNDTVSTTQVNTVYGAQGELENKKVVVVVALLRGISHSSQELGTLRTAPGMAACNTAKVRTGTSRTDWTVSLFSTHMQASNTNSRHWIFPQCVIIINNSIYVIPAGAVYTRCKARDLVLRYAVWRLAKVCHETNSCTSCFLLAGRVRCGSL